MSEESLSAGADISTHAKRTKRSDHLSADFIDGHAAGWVMAIHSCFRSSLDIELTPRIIKDPQSGQKRTEMVWTQGAPPIYNFAFGDTLYDTKAAYDRAWGDALAEISVSLQIVGASPDQAVSENSKVAGWVVVREYRPRSDSSGLDFIKQHHMTQDEFVTVLKTGLLPDGAQLKALK